MIFRTVNKLLIFLLAVLVSEVALCSGLKYGLEATAAFSKIFTSKQKPFNNDLFQIELASLSYLPPRPETNAGRVLEDIFSFVVIFNYIIPISLYVTMGT
jgi:hypothetical protein